MDGLMSVLWFFMGIIFAIAGKPFLEVAACFLIAAMFEGCWELYLLREEMEDEEDE